jgi:predicted dehydrogenase
VTGSNDVEREVPRAGLSSSGGPLFSMNSMDLEIQPQLPNRRDFRIGVLGAGFIVNDCHLVAYRKAGFNPVAIASRTHESAARVAKQHGISKAYKSIENLLDDPSIEVLDIAVPPNAQLDLIRAACKRRTVKGILAQKPLGMNYAEAVEAVLLCSAAGITLAVNQNMRYDQSVRAARSLLRRGALGEPVLASIEMRGIPHWMPWQAELGWVTLRIMSIHHLDCLRHWFGDPARVFCSVRTDPRTRFPHRDGICAYILEYDNGLRCVGLDDTWTGPAKEGCPADIYIRWRIEGVDGLAMGDIGWCKTPYTSPSSMRYAVKGSPDFVSPSWTGSWFPDAFAGTMAQLLVALETGKEPEISGRDNLGTMALVEAAYASAGEGRAVAIETIRSRHSLDLPDQGRLSPRLEQALVSAREEARLMRHVTVTGGHLLLGILALGNGVAVEVLRKHGVVPSRIRTVVEREIAAHKSELPMAEMSASPDIKTALNRAAREADGLGYNLIGIEHALLGLLDDPFGMAVRLLTLLGVPLADVRRDVLVELKS